jgi:hypothetical protein
MVANEREKAALQLVSPYARTAIRKEILPQIEESIGTKADVKEAHDHVVKEIEEAFRLKNPTYTGLIKYKSIDQSDDQFLADLVTVMDEWQRKTEETLSSGGSSDSEQEVKVKLEVESAIDVKVKPENDNVSVEVKTDSDTEKKLEELEQKVEDIEDATPARQIPFKLLDLVI